MSRNAAEVNRVVNEEHHVYKDPNKWHRQDTTWALSFFGTAIGAGVLFLPISIGQGGVLTLFLALILAYPIVYFSHRGLAKMIYGSKSAGDGITATVHWAGFGAAFGPIVILALYWRKFTSQGALAGMIVGAVTVFIWGNTALSDYLYEIVPGFLLNLIIAVIVSKITYKPIPEVEKEFDETLRLLKEEME
jgi:amino acid permease